MFSRTEKYLRCVGSFIVGVGLTACASQEVIPYETVDVKDLAAAVKGRIIFGGTMIPEAQFSKIYRDYQLCGEEVLAEELNVAEGTKGIEGVIVSLEGITKGKAKPPEEEIVIENRGCRFVPYVAATVVGSTLQVQNTDPILHTTHARFETRHGWTLWNVIQQSGAAGISKVLTVPGLVDVRCDLHPNMRSYIHVFPHPYFTTSDSDGNFEITDVPAGTYQLTVWHARMVTRNKSIVVPAKGIVTTEITMLSRRQ